MSGVGIAAYYASVGIKVDEGSLKSVDSYLKKIEDKLRKGLNSAGKGDQQGKGGLRVNAWLDADKFQKHVRSVFNGISSRSNPLLLKHVQIDPTGIRKGIESSTLSKPVRAKLTATLDRGSIVAIREQLRVALQGLTIGAKLGSVSATGTATGRRAGYSWSPNPSGGPTSRAPTTPHIAEWLGGRPGPSSISAANRRYSDSIMKSMTAGTPNTVKGFIAETVLGSLGRSGSSTMLGRGMASLGGVMGGARGSAAGLLLSAGANALASGAKLAWQGVGKIITAPFQAIAGVSNLVTSSFYKLALAAAPLVAGFMYINRTVQKGSQRELALNTVSKSLGSSGKEESKWLMNMANRDGMRYDTLIDPFTSFIASASPAMGLPMAKNVFESFTQFGLTRGANDVSMQLAMKAVSQIN